MQNKKVQGVGVLLITHENLGKGLIEATTHIMGHTPSYLKHLGFGKNDERKKIKNQAMDLVQRLDTGNGVIILTDVFGATPCNLASELVLSDKVALVAGVNLPMLLRTINYRELKLEILAEKAISGGNKGIHHVNH